LESDDSEAPPFPVAPQSRLTTRCAIRGIEMTEKSQTEGLVARHLLVDLSLNLMKIRVGQTKPDGQNRMLGEQLSDAREQDGPRFSEPVVLRTREYPASRR
jgi:hypothetical protein